MDKRKVGMIYLKTYYAGFGEEADIPDKSSEQKSVTRDKSTSTEIS